MQADLHYYSTYIAAVAAGFDHGHAVDIALAAHYVDCSGDPDPIPSPFEDIKGNLESTIGPVQMLYQAGKGLFSEANKHIWAAFHFLPSNNRLVTARVPYAWDDIERPAPAAPRERGTLGGLPAKPTEGDLYRALSADERALLPWRCFPYSGTVDAMLADTRTKVLKHLEEDQIDHALALIGVRLHVVADTFSHAGCSAPKGRGSLYSNFWIKTSLAAAANHLVHGWLPLNFQFKTRAPSADMAIGHAYYGALPDFPGLIWRADGAGFDTTTIYRNNPVVYTNAVSEIHRWLVDLYRAFRRRHREAGMREDGPKVHATRIMNNDLQFDAGVFIYPNDETLNLHPRNRDFYSRNSQRYHEFRGQKESDDYLFKRCVHLRKLIEGIPSSGTLPDIHLIEDPALIATEKAHKLGKALAARFTTSKHTWTDDDAGTEYRIVRRVRVQYFQQLQKLRAVNEAVKHHAYWFKRFVVPSLTT